MPVAVAAPAFGNLIFKRNFPANEISFHYINAASRYCNSVSGWNWKRQGSGFSLNDARNMCAPSLREMDVEHP